MTETRGQQTIKVMADYECHPLWLTGADVGDISPADPRLNLSAELTHRIATWAEQFDESLNYEDPIKSGFSTNEAEEEFAETGEEIAHDLARELGPTWRVLYHDIRADTVREILNG